MVFRWIRNYWWALALAAVLSLLFFVAASPPYYATYVEVGVLKRVLTLALGLIYFLSMALLDLSPLFILLLFVIFVASFMGIRWLWMRRRWANIIVLIILLGLNFTFVAVPGFTLSARIGEPLQECRFSYSANTILRIERYPVDVRLEYGEQAFFLISYDQGENWEQEFAPYAVNPFFLGCDNISRIDEDGLRIIFERKIDADENEIVTYESFDRGLTWTRVTDD